MLTYRKTPHTILYGICWDGKDTQRVDRHETSFHARLS